jgi:serine/threonine-protein kinase
VIGEGTSVERYELLGELATGGMATVYFGRQRGAFGFSRTVAIKSMHPQLAKDPIFRAMFVDEANLTARIRHPNVVPTLDIVSSPTKLLIVMEYVEGVSLSVLLRSARAQGKKIPVPVIAAITRDMLEGLHAAHELTDDHGKPLNVVHRDISPQNILVGIDGIARVVDFGVAKATGRSYQTQTGEIRGKVGYMAPEQMFGEEIDRRVDVYSSGVVLWESLVADRLFNAPTDAALVLLVMQGTVVAPSVARGERLPEALDALVKRALSHDPAHRFPTAAEMLRQFLTIVPPATREEVGQVVRDLAPQEIELRASYLRQSSPGIEAAAMESEARAVLEVLTRATMTRDTALNTGAQTPPGNRLVVPLSAGLMLLSIVGAVFGGTFVRKTRADRSAAAAAAAATSATAAASGSAAVPALSASAASSVAEEPTPGPNASASSDSASNAKPKHLVLPPRRPGTKAPPPASIAPAQGPKRPDCALPYTTDDEGHRHYKLECIEGAQK